MVLPALTTGARVVAKGAIGTTRASGRAGGSTIRNARTSNRTPQRNAPTVDEIYTNQQTALENNSVTQSARIRRARAKETEEREDVSEQTRPNDRRKQLQTRLQNRAGRQNILPRGAGKLLSQRATKSFLVPALWIYSVFFIGFLFQLAGIAIAAGSSRFSWIPLAGDIAASAGVSLGFLFLMFGYLLAVLSLGAVNGAVMVLKRMPIEKAAMIVTLTLIPFIQIATLGIWFSSGKDN